MRGNDLSQSLARLRAAAAAVQRPLTFMEVCGTHTMSAFRCGLHSLMPANVTLLSGPGCPVCVTAQGDIDALIELAGSTKSEGGPANDGLTLCTYGDMLRVPGRRGSLEQARGAGADVRVVYSALDALKLAAAKPDRQVIFAAVGFETTAPATAATVFEAHRLSLSNFTVFASHKMVMPAVRALLEGGRVRVDGFLLPGHVAVITGADEFAPIARDHHLPGVIAGFEGAQIAAALARLAELVRDGAAEIENLYPQAVTARGNTVARAMMGRVFQPADVAWRGLGVLPASGLVLRPEYAPFDALQRFGVSVQAAPEPAGCRCGQVITGLCTPPECSLFANTCTPTHPVGPCMVSSEGTCQAWFKYRRAELATDGHR